MLLLLIFYVILSQYLPQYLNGFYLPIGLFFYSKGIISYCPDTFPLLSETAQSPCPLKHSTLYFFLFASLYIRFTLFVLAMSSRCSMSKYNLSPAIYDGFTLYLLLILNPFPSYLYNAVTPLSTTFVSSLNPL